MTVVPEDGMLRLRLRERDEPWCEPEVAAFCGPSHARDDQPIAVMPGDAPLGPSLVIFFQPATFAIPAPAHEAELDLASWSIRTTAFGYVATVPRTRARARASWVVAACLPIALVSEAAAAPAVQRPKKVQVTPPPETEPEPAPPAEPEPPALPPETTEATSSDPFVGESGEATVEPPPPVPDPTPSNQDQAILDAAWEGVDGFDVELELKGDLKKRGRIGAVQRDTFTLIEAETGAVLVLAKSAVVSLRARTLPKVPGQTGGGLIGGGVALTVVGAPLFITGLTFLGVCTSCTSLHLPMLLIGGGLLAGGIPMIVLGARRRRAYFEALREHNVTAGVMPMRGGGWTGGLRFRF
jgi:hypothetical protein